jgi:hypothetical protein
MRINEIGYHIISSIISCHVVSYHMRLCAVDKPIDSFDGP